MHALSKVNIRFDIVYNNMKKYKNIKIKKKYIGKIVHFTLQSNNKSRKTFVVDITSGSNVTLEMHIALWDTVMMICRAFHSCPFHSFLVLKNPISFHLNL